jgi:hypothetical protein
MSQYPYKTKVPYWEDLRFPAAGINPPGAASDPSRDTSDGRLVFSASQTNTIAIQAQMPHNWKEGSQIRPHIHWSPTSADTGDVLWKVEYKIANRGDVFPGSFTPLEVLDAGSGVADMHQIIGLGFIDMSGFEVSCMLLILLHRMGADGTDTYTGTAKLNEFDIHYQVDSLGSQAELVK